LQPFQKGLRGPRDEFRLALQRGAALANLEFVFQEPIKEEKRCQEPLLMEKRNFDKLLKIMVPE
jgi:hypothetical protein